MTRDEAEAAVGKMVLSNDAGEKMIRRIEVPHGPYKLLQVTKGGLCILEGYQHQVSPSLLTLA